MNSGRPASLAPEPIAGGQVKGPAPFPGRRRIPRPAGPGAARAESHPAEPGSARRRPQGIDKWQRVTTFRPRLPRFRPRIGLRRPESGTWWHLVAGFQGLLAPGGTWWQVFRGFWHLAAPGGNFLAHRVPEIAELHELQRLCGRRRRRRRAGTITTARRVVVVPSPTPGEFRQRQPVVWSAAGRESRDAGKTTSESRAETRRFREGPAKFIEGVPARPGRNPSRMTNPEAHRGNCVQDLSEVSRGATEIAESTDAQAIPDAAAGVATESRESTCAGTGGKGRARP